jgi:hypothetical protein
MTLCVWQIYLGSWLRDHRKSNIAALTLDIVIREIDLEVCMPIGGLSGHIIHL